MEDSVVRKEGLCWRRKRSEKKERESALDVYISSMMLGNNRESHVTPHEEEQDELLWHKLIAPSLRDEIVRARNANRASQYIRSYSHFCTRNKASPHKHCYLCSRVDTAAAVTKCGRYVCWECLCRWQRANTSPRFRRLCPCCHQLLQSCSISFLTADAEAEADTTTTTSFSSRSDVSPDAIMLQPGFALSPAQCQGNPQDLGMESMQMLQKYIPENVFQAEQCDLVAGMLLEETVTNEMHDEGGEILANMFLEDQDAWGKEVTEYEFMFSSLLQEDMQEVLTPLLEDEEAGIKEADLSEAYNLVEAMLAEAGDTKHRELSGGLYCDERDR